MTAVAGVWSRPTDGRVAQTVERDLGWRWRVGGLSLLREAERADAEAAFDTWLRRYGRCELNGVRVDELAQFVEAIQGASRRRCGLEALRPTTEPLPGGRKPASSDSLVSAMAALNGALSGFLAAYRSFDEHFECLKADPDMFVPLELSPEALALDRSAWRLSHAAMTAHETAAAAGSRLVNSPLRHPFLCARTERYLSSVLTHRQPTPSAGAGSAPTSSLMEEVTAEAWCRAQAEQDDAFRRKVEAAAIPVAERAAMMRWLEASGRLEVMAEAAEREGRAVAITGFGLSRAQRSDLRGLRREISGFRSLKLDVAAQAVTLSQAHADGDEDRIARETKALERLEEMRDHHKARATFFWVRSFHFQEEATKEAEWLAPKLIRAVREDIVPDLTDQSGRTGEFLAEQTQDVRDAIGTVAVALYAAAEAGDLARAGTKALSAIRGATARATVATKSMLKLVMSKAKAVLPAIAGHVLGDDSEPTSPLDLLADAVGDWRLVGLASADRRMRRAADAAGRMSARHTLVGYARAVVGDAELLRRVREVEPALALWITRMSAAEKSASRAPRPSQHIPDLTVATDASAALRI